MIRFVLLVTLLLFPSVHCKQCTLLVVAELNRDSTGPPYSFLTVVKDVSKQGEFVTLTKRTRLYEINTSCKVKEDATLIDVMESAENQGFTYEASWHGQWGAFIDTVNGVYADSGKRQFWNIMIGLPGNHVTHTIFGHHVKHHYIWAPRDTHHIWASRDTHHIWASRDTHHIWLSRDTYRVWASRDTHHILASRDTPLYLGLNPLYFQGKL
uniref:Putative secretory peptide-28 n=1 Tax=Pleurobrachia bachei TaxID=34499 RepID=M4H1R1_PLEBA|nr:putative secretory peptide-28 [Pleurobrachia bachei]|eukprot:sb/3470202/